MVPQDQGNSLHCSLLNQETSVVVYITIIELCTCIFWSTIIFYNDGAHLISSSVTDLLIIITLLNKPSVFCTYRKLCRAWTLTICLSTDWSCPYICFPHNHFDIDKLLDEFFTEIEHIGIDQAKIWFTKIDQATF